MREQQREIYNQYRVRRDGVTVCIDHTPARMLTIPEAFRLGVWVLAAADPEQAILRRHGLEIIHKDPDQASPEDAILVRTPAPDPTSQKAGELWEDLKPKIDVMLSEPADVRRLIVHMRELATVRYRHEAAAAETATRGYEAMAQQKEESAARFRQLNRQHRAAADRWYDLMELLSFVEGSIPEEGSVIELVNPERAQIEAVFDIGSKPDNL